MKTSLDGLTLERPVPDRDAPFALSWFQASYGYDTLRLMGNAEHEIDTPSLEGEKETIREFLKLEKKGRQITWMLRYEDKTIGAAWIELKKNHGVVPPSVHIMIGDAPYRGRGIGQAALESMVAYAEQVLEAEAVYSRHLASNTVIASLGSGLGFVNDGDAYVDSNGLEWQNTMRKI